MKDQDWHMSASEYIETRNRLNFDRRLLPLFSHLAIDLLLLAAIALSFELHNFAFIPISILLPILMFRCFAMMHDAVHNAVHSKPILNNALGIVFAFGCLLPFRPWQKIHLAHHRYAGNVDKDPSMRIVKDFDPTNRISNARNSRLWRAWFPYLAIMQHYVFWSRSLKYVFEANSHSEKVKAIFEVGTPIVLYSVLLTSLSAWSILVLVPGFYLYLMLVEMVNFPHHLQMPMTKGDVILKTYQQSITTRSCHYPSLIEKHIFNFFNYHIEHHLFPTLPWYKLRGASRSVQMKLQDRYNLDLNNEWVLRNRKKDLEEIIAPNFDDRILPAKVKEPTEIVEDRIHWPDIGA